MTDEDKTIEVARCELRVGRGTCAFDGSLGLGRPGIGPGGESGGYCATLVLGEVRIGSAIAAGWRGLDGCARKYIWDNRGVLDTKWKKSW